MRDKRPLVVSYGLGVDSTAMLVNMIRRTETGEDEYRPDLILFADVGAEKPETYAYLDVMQAFLKSHGFPPVTVCRYRPRDFKNYPAYATLEENCLTNGTLPSLVFGFKSCSIKWKAQAMHGVIRHWMPAAQCWAWGQRVIRAIGYDASGADIRRRNHAIKFDDPKYECWYPLQDWGWDRERCKAEIAAAGLPVPPKSSCFFCPAMQEDEIRHLEPPLLRRIVIMEARALPRLNAREGLWIRSTRRRPGSMTVFIRREGLLPPEEVDWLTSVTPTRIALMLDEHKSGLPRTWGDFFARIESELNLVRS